MEGMVTEMKRTIRVLAADDSAVMRGVIRTIFQLHASDRSSRLPTMELCGVVRDGQEALDCVRALEPDVLLLDLEMPRMNGLQVLDLLRVQAPELPVILCSAHTERGARTTLDALARGAKDYVMKPGNQNEVASSLELLMEQLMPKIAMAAGIQEQSRPAPASAEDGLHAPSLSLQASLECKSRVDLVVIGLSTGGPAALEAMLPALPVTFEAPILVVQHMPKLFTSALSERLDRLCHLSVKEAKNGDAVRSGGIWLAPGDAHMEIGAGGLIKLHQGIPLNSCKPSVDYLFHSAAKFYGSSTLGLMMTGMGSDGLDGARALRAAGGSVLAQDQASSAVWGMPGRVVKEGISCATVALPDLAGELIERVSLERASTPWSQRRLGGREWMHGVL